MNKNTQIKGVTLISTLILLAVLVVLVTLAGTLVSSVQRTSSATRDIDAAKASALHGLELAIGELQAVAGPDQRITATAELLNSSENLYTDGGLEPVNERQSWAGVWMADREAIFKGDYPSGEDPSYDPADPDEKKFIGWLVSGTDDSGNFAIPTELSAIEETVSSGPGIDPFVDLLIDSNGESTYEAEKVFIGGSERGNRYFAFSVEDESTKVDLSWNESRISDSELSQAMRLSSAPGPDFSILDSDTIDSPFDTVTFPIAENSTGNENEFLDDIVGVMRDPSDLKTLLDSETVSDWLIDMRGGVTRGSQAVNADVKLGGLKRDLSLAFEMDEDADVNDAEQPIRFNGQIGEFVGDPADVYSSLSTTDTEVLGDDPNASPREFEGMPNPARYLYRITSETGTFFPEAFEPARLSPESIRSASVLRGPTWWALRDYYNLYKRLRGSNGDYTIDARSYYPNREAQDFSIGQRLDTVNRSGLSSAADLWDCDIRQKFRNTPGAANQGEFYYMHRPAATNYAPAILGASYLLSVKEEGDRLQLGFEPIIFLWNPFNRKIELDQLAFYFDNGLPGNVRLQVRDESNVDVEDKALVNYLSPLSLSGAGNRLSFIISPSGSNKITFQPGEIVVATPTEDSGQATLGYNLSDTSGLFIDTGLTTSSTSEINAGFYNNRTQNARLYLSSNLIDSGETAASIAASDTELGEEVQHFHMQVTNSGRDFIDTSDDREVFDPWLSAAEIAGRKRYFGALIYLQKPSVWGGEAANPVDVFSRHNPFPLTIHKDYWSATTSNFIYNFHSEQNPNELLNGKGINYAALTRNGFFGLSYESNASNSLVMSNIPSRPLLSIADFSHGNFSVMASDPFHAVGNSWSNPVFDALAPHAPLEQTTTLHTGSDLSWLMNDALFDRYMFSGIAPDYEIESSGFSSQGSVRESLVQFFDRSPDSNANPALVPYLPPNTLIEDAVDILDEDDGYMKMSAYSLINGAFNVNSTSTLAWASLLRANRGLSVELAQGGGSDSSNSETPFPSSGEPSAGTIDFWSGFSRLSDDEIWDNNDTPSDETDDTGLAAEIVREIRLRGPFMSLSDFVNRRVGGDTLTDQHFSGAIQSAIDASGINAEVEGSAGGITSSNSSTVGTVQGDSPDIITTKNIPADITQADILRSLAPKLTARGDTFRIRAYGEVRGTDRDGNEDGEINARAVCEAVVQRVPEYLDSSLNEPWDEGEDLQPINAKFGRQFKIVQFRWLTPEEIN